MRNIIIFFSSVVITIIFFLLINLFFRTDKKVEEYNIILEYVLNVMRKIL